MKYFYLNCQKIRNLIMPSRNCLVIGLGGIGYWHASSFALNGFSVSYIDPYVETNEFDKIEQINSFSGEVIIIATTSKHRAYYINEIEKNFKNCTVILEKPFFYNRQEYLNFKQKNLHNNYFINLVLDPVITNILSRNNSLPPKKISIHGSNWGLTCNILHDISILGGFVSEFTVFKFICSNNLRLINSKRKGFYEITGEIEFKIDNTIFQIRNYNKNTKKKYITITFEDCSYKLDYYHQHITYRSQNKTNRQIFEIPKASTHSYYFYESGMLPLALKYIDVSLALYSNLSLSCNLNDEYPFT